MGTRGLIGFIIKGVRRGAYNHSDSYPEAMGNDIVQFILSLREEDIAAMQKKVEAIEWICDAEPDNNHHRDLLQRVWGGQKQIVDSADFLDDGWFCEYAYFVDFERRRVEVFADSSDLTAMWTFEGLTKDCFRDIHKIGRRYDQHLLIDNGSEVDKIGQRDGQQLLIDNGGGVAA